MHERTKKNVEFLAQRVVGFITKYSGIKSIKMKLSGHISHGYTTYTYESLYHIKYTVCQESPLDLPSTNDHQDTSLSEEAYT